MEDPTLDELGRHIEQHLGASLETLKLLVPGRKGHIAPARQQGQTASEAGLSDGCTALLLASSAEDVTKVRAARELPGMRGFEDELRLAARRRRTVANAQAPRAEFTFGAYETWQRPDLNPPPSEALKLLYRLAGDPGILGVMAAHRYRVGVLSEMPPEGKVGVSPRCILGVNINVGQEISLRLRTDDLKGFRKYERIRETLIHELAHMEYGDHDDDFKQLNSQLGRECAVINARHVGGRSLLSEEASRFAATAARNGHPRRSELDDPTLLDGAAGIMAATAQLSGRTLRQLAAAGGGAAAAATTGPMATIAAAAAAVTADNGGGAKSAGSGGGACGSGSDGDSDGGQARQYEHFDAATERAEAAARRLGSTDGQQQMDGGGGGADGADGHSPEAAVAGTGGADGGGSPSHAAAVESSGQPTCPRAAAPAVGAQAVDRGLTEPAPSASAWPGGGTDPMEVEDWRADTFEAAAGGGEGGAAAEVARPAAGAAATQGAAAVSARSPPEGSSREAAEGVQLQRGQPAPPSSAPPPRPAVRLTLQPPEGLAPDGDSREAGAGVGAGLDAAEAKLRQAWGALTRMAAAAPPGTAGTAAAAEDVVTALVTLETLLGNAVQLPMEDRYRRVRLGNAAFQRRVGRVAGAVELLHVAGFVAEGAGADAELRLRRNDQGLLWLVLSAVREAREQVVAQLEGA